jgi:hypothetical protein
MLELCITEINRTQLVLTGMQNRACGPHLAAAHRYPYSILMVAHWPGSSIVGSCRRVPESPNLVNSIPGTESVLHLGLMQRLHCANFKVSAPPPPKKRRRKPLRAPSVRASLRSTEYPCGGKELACGVCGGKEPACSLVKPSVSVALVHSRSNISLLFGCPPCAKDAYLLR